MEPNTNQQMAGAIVENSLMNGVGQVAQIKEQINLIQHLMRETMKDGEHYGTIPGCGDKKALKKPGAEKLSLVFRMVPEYAITEKDLTGGHREIQIVCSLYKVGSRVFLGQGVGSCSTMENKYRYRTGPKEFTGQPVPRDYWDMKRSDPMKALEAIGGRGHAVSKNADGVWEIVKQGEKVETDNPAEVWNTILKMAKKRAHVDAVLTATAASDIFTQDLDDDYEQPDAGGDGGGTMPSKTERKPQQQQQREERRGEPAETDNTNDWREVAIHFGQCKGIQLGNLDEKNLEWWCAWTPKPEPRTKMLSASDLFLRKALDAAAVEMGFKAGAK